VIDRSASEPDREVSGRPPGHNWAVAGIVVGALAFVLIPMLLGPMGMVFGLVGYVKGARRLGLIAIVVSIFTLILGTILSVILVSMMN
jgi:hypothetical protein